MEDRLFYLSGNNNDDEINMTVKEIIEKVKQSKLWVRLTEKEQAIKHALKNTRFSITEEDIKTTVGEVYSGIQNSRRKLRRSVSNKPANSHIKVCLRDPLRGPKETV